MIPEPKIKTTPMKRLLVFVGFLAILAADLAVAGSLAPAPRIIAKYERNFLERTGAMTLEEVLDTGIIRYFLTGGLPVLVLINGRPYGTTSSDLDPIPVLAIERLEVLSGDTLGTYGGSAVRGALNVVLRTDLEGFEVHTVARTPTRDGGEGGQGSVFWGGAVGEGHMTLGVDVIKRNEITADSREYSRSTWKNEGTFSEAKNVSIGGNTVWVVPPLGESGEVRTISLGNCEPDKGYTGRLKGPPGASRSTDEGCGFAYSGIAWNTSNYEQDGILLHLDHPLEGGAEFHLDANITQAESAFRYAPSIDVFSLGSLSAGSQLLTDINNNDNGTDVTATTDNRIVVAHRFIGHGNRDWLTDTEEFDIGMGIEGMIQEDLGYDVEISAYKLDGSLTGNTFVYKGNEDDEGGIIEKILSGEYNLADPTDTANLEAIRDTSLREERDFGSDYLGARLALEGTGFSFGDRKAAWTAGLEFGTAKAHDITNYRHSYPNEDNKNESYKVEDVSGSGGTSFTGKRRKGTGAFSELLLPLTEKLDFRVAGHADELSDVGGLESWRLGTYYRATDRVTLRGSWSTGDRSPSMRALYSTAVQDHPFITCDPGSPPSPCTPNPRQVTRQTSGNPELDPSGNERTALGAQFRKWPFFLDLEWHQTSRSDLPGQPSANWAMQNLGPCPTEGVKMRCIDRTGGAITIHNGFENIVETKIQGVQTRFGSGFRTGWGIVGFRGAWRHITSAERHIQNVKEGHPVPKDAVRFGVQASRGNLSVSWAGNYRAGFENRASTGKFKSWTGHDLAMDWNKPWGLENARFAAGVLNLTDTQLTVDTSNPSSVDGPVAAGWGRTFFFDLTLKF